MWLCARLTNSIFSIRHLHPLEQSFFDSFIIFKKNFKFAKMCHVVFPLKETLWGNWISLSSKLSGLPYSPRRKLTDEHNEVSVLQIAFYSSRWSCCFRFYRNKSICHCQCCIPKRSWWFRAYVLSFLYPYSIPEKSQIIL